VSVIPESGPRRVLAVATLVSTVGKGMYLTGGVVFFTRAVHIAPKSVGIGLSVAGFAAVVSGIVVGRLADLWGPREVYIGCLLACGASTAAFALVGGFPAFLALASVATAAQSSGLVARGPIMNALGGARPQELRAYIRSVTNVGIALGAAMAGWVITLDTRGAYVALVLANGCLFLTSGLLMFALPSIPPAPRTAGPAWIALRDLPYVAMSLADGVMSIQYRVLTVAIPLWLITATTAPRWVISAIVITNTAIVVLFQVRAARGVDTPAVAGRAMRRAGFAFLAACVMVAWTARLPGPVAVGLLIAVAVIHSLGELLQAAAGFELSFSLAPDHAQGQYLGVFGVGMALAESIGPGLLTALCIGWGMPGWYVVGAMFLATGAISPAIASWAERTRHRYTGADRAEVAQALAL